MLPFSQAIAGHVASNAAHGVAVGIPLAVAASRQRSRRNSLAAAPRSIQHRQRCSQVVRASLDGPDNDEEMLRTQSELVEIEQQMLMMMGDGIDGVASDEEQADDVMSMGSSFGSSTDLRDLQLHQDLTHHSSSFTNPGPLSARRAMDAMTKCYVILFGMGETETEGIYTLRTVETLDDGDTTNVDTVVAFEDIVDAERFATLLEASLRHQPAVYSTTWGDITEWSKENAARCRLEPPGSLLLPPESNVSVTDWERALALQRGHYSVLDEEPTVAHSQQSHEAVSSEVLSPWEEAELFSMEELSFPDGRVEGVDNDLNNIVDSRMAKESLSSVREELERLLGTS